MKKNDPGYYTDLADRLRAIESRSKGPLLEEAAKAADALAELWGGPHCGNCLDRRTCIYHSFMDSPPVFRFNCVLHRRDEDV